jgi:hypothetical protein
MSKRLQDVFTAEELWELTEQIEGSDDDPVSKALIREMIRGAKEHKSWDEPVEKQGVSDVSVKEEVDKIIADLEPKTVPEDEKIGLTEEQVHSIYCKYFPEMNGKAPQDFSYPEAHWFMTRETFLRKKYYDIEICEALDSLREKVLEVWSSESGRIYDAIHAHDPELYRRDTCIPFENMLYHRPLRSPQSERTSTQERLIAARKGGYVGVDPNKKYTNMPVELHSKDTVRGSEYNLELEEALYINLKELGLVEDMEITESKNATESEDVEVVASKNRAAPVTDEVIFRAFQEKDKTFLDKIGDSITALVDWMFGWLK